MLKSFFLKNRLSFA